MPLVNAADSVQLIARHTRETYPCTSSFMLLILGHMGLLLLCTRCRPEGNNTMLSNQTLPESLRFP